MRRRRIPQSDLIAPRVLEGKSLDIWRRYQDGETFEAIAQSYRCGHMTIWRDYMKSSQKIRDAVDLACPDVPEVPPEPTDIDLRFRIALDRGNPEGGADTTQKDAVLEKWPKLA